MPSLNRNAESLGSESLVDFSRSEREREEESLRRHPFYEQLQQEALKRGFEEGQREEKAQSLAHLEKLRAEHLQPLDSLLRALSEERNAFHRENEEEILSLALALARRVVRAQVGLSPQILKAKLEACLFQLERESSYVLRVNPEEETSLRELLDREEGEGLRGVPFRLIGDRRVSAGSVILEGEVGSVESICENELDALESKLRDWIRTESRQHEQHSD